jgi:hypothetical protein
MTDQPVAAAPECATSSTSSARAEAARRNGARSRGPRTAAGKARAAQNALRHGLRAQKFVLLADENVAEFQALEEALRAELAPEGALQSLLVARIALAAWRMLRADRMEIELLDPHVGLDARGRAGGLGLALIRDGHGPRAFDTLLRYRGAVQAEFWRALRALSALKAEDPLSLAPQAGAALAAPAQAGTAAEPPAIVEHPAPPTPAADPRRDEPARSRTLHEPAAPWNPNEPETRTNRGAPPGWQGPVAVAERPRFTPRDRALEEAMPTPAARDEARRSGR